MRRALYCLVLVLIAGCGRGGDGVGGRPEEMFLVALPQPPTGWKFREKGKQAKVGDAGIHAWAVYTPAEAGDIDKVEVTISKRAKDGSTDDLKKLRRLESFEAQFMEQIHCAGFSASQSTDFPFETRRNFVLTVYPSDKLVVDIVLFPKDGAKYEMGARPKLAQSFAEQLDVEKLKALASEER